MDEVGRGTSTFDGLSLAWACAAYIARKIRAFTLFATHYFELTSLAGEAPGVVNVHVEAVEHGDSLVFLHSVKEGPANQSYGLQVAALAGIPKSVTTAARRYLTELERERDALRNSFSPQSELPLFVPPPAPVERTDCAVARGLARRRSERAESTRGARPSVPAAPAGERRTDATLTCARGSQCVVYRRKSTLAQESGGLARHRGGKHQAAVGHVQRQLRLGARQSRLLDQHRTVVGRIERTDQPAQAQRVIARDHAQVARAAPVPLARLEQQFVRGRAQHASCRMAAAPASAPRGCRAPASPAARCARAAAAAPAQRAVHPPTLRARRIPE